VPPKIPKLLFTPDINSSQNQSLSALSCDQPSYVARTRAIGARSREDSSTMDAAFLYQGDECTSVGEKKILNDMMMTDLHFDERIFDSIGMTEYEIATNGAYSLSQAMTPGSKQHYDSRNLHRVYSKSDLSELAFQQNNSGNNSARSIFERQCMRCQNSESALSSAPRQSESVEEMDSSMVVELGEEDTHEKVKNAIQLAKARKDYPQIRILRIKERQILLREVERLRSLQLISAMSS